MHRPRSVPSPFGEDTAAGGPTRAAASAAVAAGGPRLRPETEGRAEKAMQGLLFRVQRQSKVRHVQDPSSSQGGRVRAPREIHLDRVAGADAGQAAAVVNGQLRPRPVFIFIVFVVIKETLKTMGGVARRMAR